MNVLRGFQNLTGEHCATTALRQVFACTGIRLSEEMLLGLGEGIGFTYKREEGGGFPLMSMRGAGLLEFEANVCNRLGIKMKAMKVKAKKQAEKDMLRMVEKGDPAYVYVDVKRLPYARGKTVCHIGTHSIVVAGVDSGTKTAVVADKHGALQDVPLATLADARDSACSPSQHDNTMLKLTYPKTLSPIASAIESAAAEVAGSMLSARDRNSGVRGIRFFAEQILSWPDELGAKDASMAFKNAAVLIDESETGGGGFRKMYGRFLGEASRMLKDEELSALAASATGLGRKWSTVASKLKEVKYRGMAHEVSSISKRILEIADSEETFWEKLKTIFE